MLSLNASIHIKAFIPVRVQGLLDDRRGTCLFPLYCRYSKRIWKSYDKNISQDRAVRAGEDNHTKNITLVQPISCNYYRTLVYMQDSGNAKTHTGNPQIWLPAKVLVSYISSFSWATYGGRFDSSISPVYDRKVEFYRPSLQWAVPKTRRRVLRLLVVERGGLRRIKGSNRGCACLKAYSEAILPPSHHEIFQQDDIVRRSLTSRRTM